jgi:uncharacterized protein YndB with AHSA1/START domain
MEEDSMAEHTLRLSKSMEASAKQAFEAFTEPRHLSKWFTTDARADFRVGGRYSNGDNDMGEFLEIDPPRSVKFTWENEKHCPGTVVNVSFSAEEDGEIKVLLEHSRLSSQDDMRDMETGWSWALESLRSYLETGRAIPFEVWQKNRSTSG